MAVQRVINCFFFSPFHNARKNIAPLHNIKGSLLETEGSAYTDFTTCIIMLHHIRKWLGCAGERKRRSPKLSFSQGKEGPKIDTQLSPVN